MRTGEVVARRRGDLDLRKGELTVRRSRTLGEDNPPKTNRSHRTMKLVPGVVAVLRAMSAPLHATDETCVFTTPTGRPIDEERFVEKHWHRAIRATGIRPRKFYATRHAFISVALTKGANLKWVARYCGTSVEMVDEHYGKWLGDDGGQLAILAPRPTAGDHP
jgi:integrase